MDTPNYVLAAVSDLPQENLHYLTKTAGLENNHVIFRIDDDNLTFFDQKDDDIQASVSVPRAAVKDLIVWLARHEQKSNKRD